MLSLINNARANPPAAAEQLLNIAETNPTIENATRGSSLATFAAILSSLPPLPPLAFNTGLIEAARDHDAAMLAINSQFHSPTGYLTDPAVAVGSDGEAYYPVGTGAWATGENVYAYSGNVNSLSLTDYVNYLEDGLMIDWGVPGLSHLENLMAPGPAQVTPGGHLPFSEIGIGLLTNAYPTVAAPANPEFPADSGMNVGPVIVTQELAGGRETPI